MATQKTIRNIIRGFDRIDAYLDNLPEEAAKIIEVRVNKMIKKFGIPANKNSLEGNRASAPPSTKEVAANNKRGASTTTSTRKPKQESKSMAKELSTAEIKAYAEDHGLKFKRGADKNEIVAAHQKAFNALVKKGADKLVSLAEKHLDDFKISGRVKKEETRAKLAADAILAAGFVPEGRGIAKPDEDEKSSKKTSKKTEKVKSKKEDTKVKSKKRSRDEDDDEDDEDEAPKRKSKKTVAEKPAKKGKKVVEKTTKKKVRRDDDDEDEAPKKKVKKTSSKVAEKTVKSKKKAKKSRD